MGADKSFQIYILMFQRCHFIRFCIHGIDVFSTVHNISTSKREHNENLAASHCGWSTFEPPHDKTNKMTCAPSKDSDQPWHSPSLIRVFAAHVKKAWVLSYPLSAQRRLIRPV